MATVSVFTGCALEMINNECASVIGYIIFNYFKVRMGCKIISHKTYNPSQNSRLAWVISLQGRKCCSSGYIDVKMQVIKFNCISGIINFL